MSQLAWLVQLRKGLLLLALAWLQLPAGAVVNLTLGHQFPIGSIPDRAAQKFVALVAEKTKGEVQIALHPAGTFGDEREHLVLLRKQALDFAVTGDLVVSSLGDRYLVVNMPFLYRDTAHALASYDGPLGDEIRHELKKRGLLALSWHHVGTRMLTANKPLRTLADLTGLSLRLPQDAAWVAAWRALGAVPRQIPFTDLALALKHGRVEAQENPPGFIRASKLYEHQKYLMTTQHMPQRQFILAAERSMSNLTPELRKRVQEAAKEASRWAVVAANEEHIRDLNWLVTDGGMTLVTFDMTGMQEALRLVPQALAAEAGVAVYNQILAIR